MALKLLPLVLRLVALMLLAWFFSDPKRYAIPFAYNLRSVTNRPVSTATTAIGIGLTVSIFIGALALAAGFRASLVTTGSPDNAIVLRKGADSEISSGVTLDQTHIITANPAVAVGPDGRPRASAEMVIVVNKERLGQ